VAREDQKVSRVGANLFVLRERELHVFGAVLFRTLAKKRAVSGARGSDATNGRVFSSMRSFTSRKSASFAAIRFRCSNARLEVIGARLRA
jgi:hypothetical protein